MAYSKEGREFLRQLNRLRFAFPPRIHTRTHPRAHPRQVRMVPSRPCTYYCRWVVRYFWEQGYETTLRYNLQTDPCYGLEMPALWASPAIFSNPVYNQRPNKWQKDHYYNLIGQSFSCWYFPACFEESNSKVLSRHFPFNRLQKLYEQANEYINNGEPEYFRNIGHIEKLPH